MRRAMAAAAAGATLGIAPFAAWVFLPPENSFSEFVTDQVANNIKKHNFEMWQRGDKRPQRIILMRHGQTHGYSHTCDCQVAGLPVCALKPEIERPLTEEGKLQALRAGVALKHIIGDDTCTFYVSPYKSCKQSFSYVSGSFTDLESLQYVEDPRLRNQDHGDWHLNTAPEKMEEYKHQSEKIGSFFYRWPQGESAAEVYDRVSSFMETMYRKWKHVDRPNNYVIITHSKVIHCFLMRWFHWDVNTFNRLEKFKNGQLAVMEKQTDGSYKLVSPLPIKPPIPEGVKHLASNPHHAEP
mmetsp:Transcript_12981/g.25184  ORF Transcript_12981/g.25184 Transcript_12981/m.25184 type:complete len:297 (+) Transcript_12981:272-1162(+)|eukprot:CAMPEP_0171502420 /NCGR_PEP_ID=MMETSP0958-20121227/10168_1 /TAXON_ID=87120 /ORGANISM="Aurantiochytrium limacinum, Strain ATCCMYA-1381" /LENGTH=296 /DNA_ID=CAMNT_0012037473 /DNA_START=192 /DNA_END=1082 /DNA_ORIENTATION=-